MTRTIRPLLLAALMGLLANAVYTPRVCATALDRVEDRATAVLAAGHDSGGSAAIKEGSRTVQPMSERDVRHVPGTTFHEDRPGRAQHNAATQHGPPEPPAAPAPPLYCLHEAYLR